MNCGPNRIAKHSSDNGLSIGTEEKDDSAIWGEKASLESLSLEGTFKILCRERGRERPGIEEN